MEWQDIESAPRNDEIILAYWRNIPVMVSWSDGWTKTREKRVGPFWRRKTVTVEAEVEEAGFRVVMLGRDGEYSGWHGNYAPFMPTHWMPLPPPPGE